MAALPLDNEFMEYWIELSLPKKESLLSAAKNFVELKRVQAISVLSNIIKNLMRLWPGWIMASFTRMSRLFKYPKAG